MKRERTNVTLKRGSCLGRSNLTSLDILLAVCWGELGIHRSDGVVNLSIALRTVEIVQERQVKNLLTDLSQIDTEQLVVLASPEVATRNTVDSKQEDHGEDERPTHTRERVGKLVTKLNPVMVDPTTTDRGDAVKVGHTRIGKESSKDVADKTTNTVRSKDIKSVIVAKNVLEASGKVACGTTDDTESQGRGGSNVTGSRCDSNQTRNGTGTESHSRPLAFEPPIPEHPSQATDGSRNVGHHHRLNRPQVGTDLGTTVEAEPTEPEEDGAEDDVGDVVRTVSQLFGTVAITSAEEDRDGEGSGTGRDVHGCTSCEIETTHNVGPTETDVPSPVGDGVVDDGSPAEGEDEDGTETGTISEGTTSDDDGDSGKHQLVDAVEKLRDESTAGRRLHVDTDETEVVQVL